MSCWHMPRSWGSSCTISRSHRRLHSPPQTGGIMHLFLSPPLDRSTSSRKDPPMKTSIGTWACSIGPYAKNPVDFNTVGAKLAVGYDALELDAFPPHPNLSSFFTILAACSLCIAVPI